MRKITIALLGFLMTFSTSLVRADEGMWLPLLIERLNYVDMQKKGLQLTAEEIYSVNHSSLKDAIIQFGNGCTGEIISPEGLILTNHHCGYGNIQAHSTVDHDYLQYGFWAMSKEQELANPGLTAKFLVRIEDVSKQVLSEINKNLTEKERAAKADEVGKKIAEDAVKGTHYKAEVKMFFDGNEYYLFVYEIFLDVRLVGAPPSSIGKFGADTDNWMWPRHTGDFSMFRVYMGPDGKPAPYSKDNVPLKPKHYLPISLNGVKQGDYAMTMGYPGTTDRFLTSYGIKLALDVKNMSIVNIRGEKLAIMRQYMDASPAVRIQYSSKYAQTANYWKYFIGQDKQLKHNKVYDKKLTLENQFTQWVNQDAARKEKYGMALSYIAQAYDSLTKYEKLKWYFNECFGRGVEAVGLAWRFNSLVKLLDENKADDAKKIAAALKASLEKYFNDYNVNVDKHLMRSMIKMFFENVPADQQPAEFIKLINKNKKDYNRIAEKMYASTLFTDKAKLEKILDAPDAKVIKKDPVYQLASMLFENYINITKEKVAPNNEMLQKGNRLFVAGIREMQPDKKFAPNANSTMRLSYGQVLDYMPADAVHYDFRTTMLGVMEKEDPNNWEFVVPDKLKELYKNKDFGLYGEGETMPVCFLTTNDITGGNSGSPVINGKGELIGLAFDGNWEAMSGDISYEPTLQRTICVDIRYVMFIIDKYAGAKNIINELTYKAVR